MVAYYRLSELGYRLAPGLQVLPPEAFEPVPAATALLRDAEARAAAIVAEAEQEYARRSAQGYADGLARAELESVERLLREGVQLDAGLKAAEAEMARIVMACVRRLVDSFDDEARTVAAVRGALRQMRRERRAELRVAPAHYAAMRDRIAGIVADFPEVEFVDVVEDPALMPPQIVLESSIGRVETAVDAGLDALEAIVRGAAAGHSDSSADPAGAAA
ncbi:Yop proteins translocation protein L [Methylobacterium hispanicum]|uniref:Type 3 secretion system stator protein n=1 Tax=Methylobacterium hispanicum TaxID=270350 RepID=A0AAV4ZU71_9HYPH|nr:MULTISPECIES: type III secretion system stator protein SctL [Methylobacterium]GJD91454.1 Yop proteins translocation protein L [Methylobacterium hispanicum]